MKKLLISGVFAILSVALSAQNIQLHYDLGHNMYKGANGKDLSARGAVTTTVEMFRPDAGGSTFFFVDMDYMNTADGKAGVLGAYWEIAREFNFWQDSKVNWLSAHVEYNGGCNTAAGSFNNAWLVGPTYSGHSKDFSKTWSLSVLYKLIPGTIGLDGGKQPHSFQVTGVWGINFAHGWCTFSGFFDFWKEARIWQGTEYIFLTEPQFWVNFNQIKGMEKINLSLGTEVEISNNFVNKGFYCVPTLAAKWTF